MPERNRLPRGCSLKSRTDLDRLFSEGQRLPGDSFILIWRPALEFRYAVLVPKAYGKAHERNRLKRLYREAIRLARDELVPEGWVGMLPRRGCGEPEFGKLKADVRRLFRQISNQND